MKVITGLVVLLTATLLLLPDAVFARGFGGGGHGGGGGGGIRGGGGGGARPGGGAKPNFGGGGGARPNNVGGGGARPNFGGGGGANHSPSFSHPTGGGSSRPNFGIGNRPEIGGGGVRPGAGGSGTRNPGLAGGGVRPGAGGSGTRNPGLAGGGVRPGAGGSGTRNPGLAGGGVRPGAGGSGTRNPGLAGGGVRPGAGGSGTRNPINAGGGIGNRTNFGNRTNIGHVGNNNFNNIHNNINIASNRSYNNNWHHGNWNGNWNRPGGGGYVNGWAHGYARGYMRGGWGGYWHGGFGGYWGRPWYAAPIRWGLGVWAVGSIMYNSGYASYSNPYYSGGSASAYYDYSQPITVINQQPDASAASEAGPPPADAASTPVPPEVQEGTTHSDLARDAFKNGDYVAASREIDLAIKALPKDAALHEFRALVFFATKDYKQAAATLYAVLSAGPGWDWTTLSGMYATATTYTDQLRVLEEYVKANPGSSEAHFVLAYQYLTCGHTDAAKKQYEEVLKRQPADQLSAQLVKLLGGDTAIESPGQPTPQPPDTASSTEEDPTPPADIDATKIVGQWTAKRPDGSSFSLNLTADSKFTWGFAQGTKKQEFGGKYSVDGAVLVLERSDGSQMPGLVTLADSGFNFKLYGGQPDDPGLNFKK